MTAKTLQRFAAALLPAAICLVSGCAGGAFALRREAPVTIEHVLSEDVYISETHAYEDGDTLVVYGKVKRAIANCCGAARGHVDIAAAGPDGHVLQTVGVQYSPRNVPKVRSRASHFTTRLPYPIPAGATLRIAYHNDHDLVSVGGGVFVCRKSAALAGPSEEPGDLRTAGM